MKGIKAKSQQLNKRAADLRKKIPIMVRGNRIFQEADVLQVEILSFVDELVNELEKKQGV